MPISTGVFASMLPPLMWKWGCDCCRHVEEVELDETDVCDRASNLGLTVPRTVLEAHGLCPRCAVGGSLPAS